MSGDTGCGAAARWRSVRATIELESRKQNRDSGIRQVCLSRRSESRDGVVPSSRLDGKFRSSAGVGKHWELSQSRACYSATTPPGPQPSEWVIFARDSLLLAFAICPQNVRKLNLFIRTLLIYQRPRPPFATGEQSVIQHDRKLERRPTSQNSGAALAGACRAARARRYPRFDCWRRCLDLVESGIGTDRGPAGAADLTARRSGALHGARGSLVSTGGAFAYIRCTTRR